MTESGAKLSKAIKLSRAGCAQKALDLFSEIIETNDEQRHVVLGHRAWQYRQLGLYEAALRDYEALLCAEPENLDAAARRAGILFLRGDFREGAAGTVAVLVKDPLNSLAMKILADCQRALGVQAADRAEFQDFPFPKIPGRPLNEVIEKLEADGGSYPGSVYPGLGRLLYTLVRCCRPRLALEIGTHVGYSALCIAQGLADDGGGHLHSFDLFDPIPGYRSPVAGEAPDLLSVVRAHLERAGLARWATLHQGDSSSTIRQVFGARETLFDFAFIDGDHSIRGCLKDWHAVDELIDEGGLVLLHDTEPARCEWLGPRYLMEELEKRGAGNYQVINLPTADGVGLGIIQKKTKGRSPRWKPSLKDLLIQRLFDRVNEFRRKRRQD